MRTSTLVLLLALSALVLSNAALAAASGNLGKPVCTRYDEATKQSGNTTTDAAGAPAVASSATATPVVANATVTAKGGGTEAPTHPRSAPRWQTFLPGMFR